MKTTTQIVAPLAGARPQTLAALAGNDFDDKDDFDGIFAKALLSQIPDMSSVTVGVLSSLIGPGGMQAPFMTAGAMPILGRHAGRNMALADPESAYRMMTLINSKDVLYKAQRFELGRMGGEVARMQAAGQRLGDTAENGGDIKAALHDFIGQYNDWIQRFAPDMNKDGMLAGTQAAQLSRHELEQSVRNVFNGVGEGLHGLGDLGVSVGVDGTLSLDASRLDATLQANPKGVAVTLRDFGASFAKSAELLNAAHNFIPSHLDNLDRAIRYIDRNHSAWQAEFGLGEAARPAGQVAEALAAYQRAAN